MRSIGPNVAVGVALILGLRPDCTVGNGTGNGPDGAGGGSDENAGDATPDASDPVDSNETGEDADTQDQESDDESEEEGSDDEDSSDDADPKFDVGTPDEDTSDGDEDDFEYSYIWISNSTDGTVSKIHTRTMIEDGRYVTRPDRAGDPSRTSVGMEGNVAVANRNGGIVKIYADPEDCKDGNGDGSVSTSTGPTEVLDWGEEECVAWYRELEYDSQRAVAWTAEKTSDRRFKERVWVTGSRNNYEYLDILLLDGQTGETVGEAQTDLEGKTLPNPFGSYGGAVDRENNFWFSNTGSGAITMVSYEDYTVTTWDKPQASYGITVDSQGRPWVCGFHTARFDVNAGTWTDVQLPADYSGVDGGCMADGEGRLWLDLQVAGRPSLAAIDIETLEVVKHIPVTVHPHGVSIDFDGNVWGVTKGSTAYRVNPESEAIDEVDGLIGAYTYSDMTGFALGGVVDPPK